jgi:GxxExxY protein
MNADLDKISEQIIGAAFEVGNILGAGFLEKVYENALVHELKKRGLLVEQQKRVTIYYDGVVVGDYYSDLLVEGLIIVELKAASRIDNIHLAQCLNYLKATGLNLGLILNFGNPRVEIKRVVNNYPPHDR